MRNERMKPFNLLRPERPGICQRKLQPFKYTFNYTRFIKDTLYHFCYLIGTNKMFIETYFSLSIFVSIYPFVGLFPPGQSFDDGRASKDC